MADDRHHDDILAALLHEMSEVRQSLSHVHKGQEQILMALDASNKPTPAPKPKPEPPTRRPQSGQ